MVNEISNSSNVIRGGFAEIAKRELAKREEQAAQSPQPSKSQKQAKAEENYVPAPESLSTLIRNAIAAFKSGNIFDRGSIVNLVV